LPLSFASQCRQSRYRGYPRISICLSYPDGGGAATGKTIVSISAGSSKDVDIAVQAAKKAYKTSWGVKVSGADRGKMLHKLADLIEKHADEIAALECLDVGETNGQ